MFYITAVHEQIQRRDGPISFSTMVLNDAQINMHNDAYIGGRLKNNIKCVVHDDLG